MVAAARLQHLHKPVRAGKRQGSGEPSRGYALIDREEIDAALRWRLDGIPCSEFVVIAAQLRPLLSDFRDDRAEVVSLLQDLRRPGDRRAPWSLACAILAADAADRNDLDIYWPAGMAVVEAYRHARIGKHQNRRRVQRDALDNLIADFIKHFPGTGPAAMFDHLATIADTMHEVVIEHDCTRDELVCQLDDTSPALSNVGRHEVKARISRVRSETQRVAFPEQV